MNGNTSSGPRRKPRRAMAFLQNKIFILFFLPVIALIIIIAVVLIIRLVNPPEQDIAVSASGDYIYVLPIKERPADNISVTGKDPFAGSSMSSLILGGILYNPDGTSNVIIVSAEKSYIVSRDEMIGQTGWIVTEISADTVKITKNEKSEILSIPAKTIDGLYINDTEGS